MRLRYIEFRVYQHIHHISEHKIDKYWRSLALQSLEVLNFHTNSTHRSQLFFKHALLFAGGTVAQARQS